MENVFLTSQKMLVKILQAHDLSATAISRLNK